MKTADLTGPALDWAVAKCEGLPLKLDPMGAGASSYRYFVWPEDWPPSAPGYLSVGGQYRPSTDWAQGGPIIEREKLTVGPCYNNLWWAGRCDVMDDDHTTGRDGPTPLIAAMRCYVASKLGDEVDVPEELK
jgi:hypothetical protein